jgi:hypothetical protein
MKFDRQILRPTFRTRCSFAIGRLAAGVWSFPVAFCLLICVSVQPLLWGQAAGEPAAGAASAAASPAESDPAAKQLALRTMERLAMGDAFDAKIRQRIWAGGREVVGVGHYEQTGGGSGRYSLELTIHDGESRQTMKQISDGKLAWHRTHIGSAISVRRVDLGRIDEYEREYFDKQNESLIRSSPVFATRMISHPMHPQHPRLPTRLLVGGLVELLDQITSDYSLRLGKGTVDRQPVWILRGKLTDAARERIAKASGREDWAPLCPVEVRVAIAATADATGFGAGLPLRIEFWSSPEQAFAISPTAPVATTSTSAGVESEASDSEAAKQVDAPGGRLISLLEVYSMRKIEPSPEERFRFVADDRAGTFSNDTNLYLERATRP